MSQAQRTLTRSRVWPWIALLLVLLIGSLLAVSSLNITSTQTKAGQCPFVPRQEAFLLAQEAEQTRVATPFAGNYGDGSYTICFRDGSSYHYFTEVYQGYNSATASGYPAQKAHSEQRVDDELYAALSTASFDNSQLVGIYVVIFSQVIVCPPCQQEMRLWQRELRQAAHTTLLFLSIWQMHPGKAGFDPKKFPAGTGTPVTIDDLQQVFIRFAP
jgi:hypothetical protein